MKQWKEGGREEKGEQGEARQMRTYVQYILHTVDIVFQVLV